MRDLLTARLLAKVKEETGVELVTAEHHADEYTRSPSRLVIGNYPPRPYYSELNGPWMDPEDGDVRIFIHYRVLEGQETIVLLLQDATDDAFLIPRADGIEKYRAGEIFYL